MACTYTCCNIVIGTGSPMPSVVIANLLTIGARSWTANGKLIKMLRYSLNATDTYLNWAKPELCTMLKTHKSGNLA
jgi:hypothetical protein